MNGQEACRIYVRSDEKRLRQILVNLLSNAIKFTDEGTVSFDVTYRSQVATFTVTDTGRGIAQKDLARIYEPFQRGEAETIKPMPGGLALVSPSRSADQYAGGEISVQSEKGCRLHLPRAADALLGRSAEHRTRVGKEDRFLCRSTPHRCRRR